ncbi:MAG TPA: NUDIX domain-containing protein [Candidatus Paceibacterota bacterium]
MTNRPPTFYAAAYLVLIKDGKVLLIHRVNTGWMDQHWGMPAGHIEGTESVLGAVRRETKEEVGIDLPKNLQLSHVMHRSSNSSRTYFDFFFMADSWAGEIRNNEPDKHDMLQWFSLSELPENIIPYLKRVLERIQNGVFFSEDITG